MAIARKYQVTEKTIRDIWCGRSWRHETLGFSMVMPAEDCALTLRPRGRPRKTDKIFDIKNDSRQAPVAEVESNTLIHIAATPETTVAATPETEINWDELSCLANLSDSECSPETEISEAPAQTQHEEQRDCEVGCVESDGGEHLWLLEQTAWHNMWNLHQLGVSCPAMFELPCSVPEDDPFHTDWSEVCAP